MKGSLGLPLSVMLMASNFQEQPDAWQKRVGNSSMKGGASHRLAGMKKLKIQS
jgi:hypothetical protein